MTTTKALRLAVPLLAAAMLALTLIPAELWRAPAVDASYHGFDSNLIYTTGSVDMTPERAVMHVPPSSMATLDLSTTLRRKLMASVDVSGLESAGALRDLRIGVWSPWTRSGYFVVFGPAPDDAISIETISNGIPGPTLTGGHATSTLIGHFAPNTSYRVAFAIDRVDGYIQAKVSSAEGLVASMSLIRSQSPAIFGNVQLSLSTSAEALAGTGQVTLSNYTLTLPHERWWAAKVSDVVAESLLIALGLLGLASIVVIVACHRRAIRARLSFKRPLRPSHLAIGGAAIYLVGNAVLFPLGGHPFDFANEQLYAYVARTYGPVHLYFLPDVTSLANVWQGIPWEEAAFPYQPVIAYLFTTLGWLSSVLFAGGGAFALASSQLSYVIKGTNVAFGLADGWLIYRILCELDVSERWSRIGGGLFIFNPAVWFSMSIWGQTHVISIFLVLAAVLFAQRNMPLWAWLSLAAACLTRPQMIIFGLLLGVAFLKKFSLRESLRSLSWTLIVTFVALLPLTLATSPSLPIDIMLNVFRIQEAGGNEATLSTVSQGAYSIWPLVTYLFHGASGLQREFTSSGGLLIGSITYQQASQVLTVVAMLLVTGALLMRKRSGFVSGGYLPLVTVGVTAFLMLLTGVVATHFLLALPLLLLCRPWMDRTAYLYVVAIWTVSTLVPMFGDMGVVITANSHPLLAPAHNPVTRFFVDLHAWDRFITVAVFANLCAVVWLAYLTIRGRPQNLALARN